ncbi:hypothetical protein BC827DRAFT_217774 [Russula dissimulans]|nr:hypothetical protein BC827DRAFT_217774 [Russula dissimulans]
MRQQGTGQPLTVITIFHSLLRLPPVRGDMLVPVTQSFIHWRELHTRHKALFLDLSRLLYHTREGLPYGVTPRIDTGITQFQPGLENSLQRYAAASQGDDDDDDASRLRGFLYTRQIIVEIGTPSSFSAGRSAYGIRDKM